MILNMTGATSDGNQCPEAVEKQLKHVSKKLAETEVNIGLFSKMVKKAVPTNDVRHFVLNQTRMKQSNDKVQFGVVKKIMRNKLNDACSVANKLRQKKKRLKRLLCTKFDYPSSKHRRVMKKISMNTANHKGKFKTKTNAKFRHCESKMSNVLTTRALASIPPDTWEIAKGVNVF